MALLSENILLDSKRDYTFSQVPMRLPSEIVRRLVASGDKLSSIRHDLTVQRSKMRDQFEQTRLNRFALMTTDLDVGLTLVKIAATSHHASTRTRNRTNARLALNTIVDMLPQSTLTQDERVDIEGKIAELQAALKQLAI